MSERFDPISGEFKPTTADLIGQVVASPTANTVLDRLKALYTALTGTLTVAGSVTANAGTNLNTSALALEAGNLAGIKAQTDKFEFDPVSGHLEVIDQVHGEIHKGSNFFYMDSVELGVAGTQDYLFTTPNTAIRCHWLFSIDFLFVTDLNIFEGSDKTGTTAQTTPNAARNSATTATATLHKGTSGGTTDGTSIFHYKSGLSTGTGANHISSGGGLSGRHELVLKQNTKYIVRLTSSTAANLINVDFNWYET